LLCLPVLVVLATEGYQSLNKTTSTTINLEKEEERSSLEETISSEKTEKRSNMEKAEERRANMMQEILEEDLGEMKIRLIALEKKVDKLHPVVGGWCPWKYVGEAVFEESAAEKSALKEITWQGRCNFEGEDAKPHRSFVNHEEVIRWVRVCECPVPSQATGFCNGTDIRERGEVSAWARDEAALEYGYGEEPWEDEEWKSFGGKAQKGLTCTRVSFH